MSSAKEDMLMSHSETSRGRVSRSFGGLIRLTAVASLMMAVAMACGGATDVFSLEVGDCFEDPDTGFADVSEVETVQCSESHDNEIYAIADHPAGDDAPYPGQDALESYGLDYCLSEFESYVGAPYADSRLDFSYFYPLSDGWESDDDREFACFLYDLDFEKLTESMKDSGE